MSNELIKYAFTAGEISDKLFGRSDLEQYDLGVALGRNWLVDYRGGLSTRMGFGFCDYFMHDDKEIVLFDFEFSSTITNVYLVIFGDNYIRFAQDGAYVLEAPKAITDISGNVVTSVAHGFANGDWVKITDVIGLTNINTRTFQVANVTTDTFELLDVPTLDPWLPQGIYSSVGTVSRIYTVVSPYAAADLPEIYVKQRRDLLRITHPAYATRNLVRAGSTNWTISVETISNGVAAPTGLGAVASGAASAGIAWSVTALLADGTESAMANPSILASIVNYSTTAGSVTMNWAVHPKAVAYNVYRSRIFSDGAKVNLGTELGYIGKAVGSQFTDNNIIPDFTKAPPNGDNPFAPGRIESITVTAGGAGYTSSSTVSVAGGGGSGFRGVPVVNYGGGLIGVRILDRGSGYVNPVVSFGGAGAGATATAVAAELVGVYPSISANFQQRQIYAATLEEPLTLWGSKIRKPSNFDYSDITIDSDAYEFEIDSEKVSPIRHMVALRGGLIVMSATGVWLLSGGNEDGVTASNALADPQNYTGVSEVPPLEIGPDLLYVEGKGFAVRLLSYNEIARVYGGEDKSLLSNHLFANGKRITSWAFAENPFKIVHAVRSDGALLHFTVVKDEKVFAWTWSTTKGQFLNCRSVLENDVDRLYVVTKRFINGRWTKFLERAALRELEFSEDAFNVDCGLELAATYPAASIALSAPAGDDIVITASSGIFSALDVGKVLRAGGGKIYITAFESSLVLHGRVARDVTDVVAEDPENTVLDQASGSWSLDLPVSEIGGLWHLEGQEVQILADGNVLSPRVVVNGSVTLDDPASRVVVGLKYRPIAKTLPPVVSDVVIEARRKRIVGVAARVSDTRGLSTGASLDHLYDMKERTNETYGEPTLLFDGIRVQLIEPVWDENGQTYFVQDNPLPATLLGIVFDMEVGDDPD